MTTSIKIIATLLVKSQYRHELNDEFQKIIQASRKEKGNISYNLHEALDNPNKLVFIENWESQYAIDEHNKSLHFEAFIKAIEGKIENLDIVLIKEISKLAN